MYGVIDIGGTKTILGVFDNAGSLADSTQITTPSDYAELLKACWVYFTDKPIRSIGVSTAGIVSRPDGIVTSFGPNIPWGERALARDLTQRHAVSVIVENDANCGALGEALYGSATDYRSVFYITISTGIGTGFVFDKKIVQSVADSEGGNLLVPKDKNYEPLEMIISGQALVKTYDKLASELSDAEVWNDFVSVLGPAIQAFSVLFTPDVIVFGGSVSAQYEKFFEPLALFLQQNMPERLKMPTLLPASDTKNAVLFGALALAKNADQTDAIWS